MKGCSQEIVLPCKETCPSHTNIARKRYNSVPAQQNETNGESRVHTYSLITFIWVCFHHVIKISFVAGAKFHSWISWTRRGVHITTISRGISDRKTVHVANEWRNKRLILIVGRSPVFPFCGLGQRLIIEVIGQFLWFLEMLTFPVKNKDLGLWQVRCGNDLSIGLLFLHQLCPLGFS